MWSPKASNPCQQAKHNGPRRARPPGGSRKKAGRRESIRAARPPSKTTNVARAYFAGASAGFSVEGDDVELSLFFDDFFVFFTGFASVDVPVPAFVSLPAFSPVVGAALSPAFSPAALSPAVFCETTGRRPWCWVLA